jgi:hypothetical protein
MLNKNFLRPNNFFEETKRPFFDEFGLFDANVFSMKFVVELKK